MRRKDNRSKEEVKKREVVQTHVKLLVHVSLAKFHGMA